MVAVWVDLASLPHGVEVVEPASADKAAEAVGAAAGAGRPVAICGSGSRWHWQPPPAPDSLLLSTLGLVGEVDVHAENLTAGVPAGLPLFRVRRRLEEQGFWLPLIHADGPDASSGGCLAAGFTNPLRLGYGLPRDWVLGLDVISPDGRLDRFGGELVKNVAGYDLVKMHLGAWGRLGLITRTIFRLLPLPESQATVEVRAASAAAVDGLVRAALRHEAQPCALEVAGDATGWLLRAWLVGDLDGTGQRAEALAQDVEGRILTAADHLASWSGYALHRNFLERKAAGRLKVTVRPPGLETLHRFLNARFGEEGWSVCGQAGSGVYTVFLVRGGRAAVEGGAASVAAAAHGVDGAEGGVAAAALALRRDLEPAGHVVLEGRPAAQPAAGDWHSFPPRAPRPQDRLEAALVRSLSPKGWLNPHLPFLPGAPDSMRALPAAAAGDRAVAGDRWQ